MNLLILFFIAITSPLSATYLLFFDEDQVDCEKKKELYLLVMQNEPPGNLYSSESIDLENACRNIVPSIKLQWICPTVWQIGAIGAFFSDPEIQESILKLQKQPLEYEDVMHIALPRLNNVAEISLVFRNTLHSALFFQINRAVCQQYIRAKGCERAMMDLVRNELPLFSEWKERKFPFWSSYYIGNPKFAEIFYSSLMDKELISKLLEIEHFANEQNEWVLYRGYEGSGYPTTLEIGKGVSHALSFGSTLLGGVFFSLGSCALTYAKPAQDDVDWRFLALRVCQDELKSLFRIGLLHPFLQLIADGEMFHAHTKIAVSSSQSCMQGYFMAKNQQCEDPAGYILASKLSPEELEQRFYSLCLRSGVLF